MKLNPIFIVVVALLLISSGNLLADKTILQVSGNLYSREQIKAVMAENGYDSPEQVVEKLQRDTLLAEIYARYRELHQSELTALRLALSGHTSGEALPFPLLDAFRKARVEIQKKSIAQALTTVEIQTWQYKSNSLSLSMPDALQQLTEVKYKALVADALQRLNIQF